MEISLRQDRLWPLNLATLALVALAVLGRAVTPILGGRPAILTPERRQARLLTHAAAAETTRLVADARLLRDLAEHEPPDPIAAMLLAQRIYAAHRQGTAATAAARQALIAAAEATARYAGGGLSRQEAVANVNAALARVGALRKGSASPDEPVPGPTDLGSVRPGRAATP
jgi:hypothetical protein